MPLPSQGSRGLASKPGEILRTVSRVPTLTSVHGPEGIYREPPSWYVGTNVASFNLHSFSTRLGEMVEPGGEHDVLRSAQLK